MIRSHGALAVALVTLVAGCGNRAELNGSRGSSPAVDPAPAAALAVDTVRGTIAVVGADPTTRVIVRAPAGILTVTGPLADTLRAISGIDVRLVGHRSEPGELHGTAFRVRAVDGVPADDGVLELEGETAVLRGPEGERARFTPAPLALRRLVGRHVWISGRPGETPEAWGLIGPAR